MQFIRPHLAFALLAIAAAPAGHASCGTAFCALNTNWDSQGLYLEPGARLDVRYEYIPQEQPRAGSNRVAVGEIPREHDEVKTINRNWLFSFDYLSASGWGVTVTMPVVDRYHVHNENTDDGPVPEQWKFTELGDVRVLGRYQFAPTTSGEADDPKLNVYGLYFGAKLPTGSFTQSNPEGEVAERSLQPGSGTTNALFGGYFRQSVPLHDFAWFAGFLVDAPLASRSGYKPGNRFGVDLGVRYDATEKLGLLLQFNALFRGRDSGPQADAEDSGGRSVFISPGVMYAVTHNTRVWAFYQQPIYQYVNGVQLTANWAAIAGFTVQF